MPSRVDDELAETARLVDQRVAMGDRASEPRRVDHVAFFRTPAAAERAISELEVAGFEVIGTSRRMLRVAVEFARNDAVDHQAAADFTREIVTVVSQQGGTYDGWGAPLIT